MEPVLFASGLAVIISLGGLKENKGYSLGASFFLLFVLMGVRYEFGNDYVPYQTAFSEINSYVDIDPLNFDSHFEIGWVVLCRLFGDLGFFSLVFFLTGFSYFSFWYFIKGHVPPRFHWLAVFIFCFDPAFMLIGASAMRQSLAVAVFLIALSFLNSRAIIIYVVLILLAATFHTSALILLALTPLGFVEIKVSRFFVFFVVLSVVGLFLTLDSLAPYLNAYIGDYFERYATYEGGVEIGSGLGIVVNLIFLSLILYGNFGAVGERARIVLLASIAFFFIPLSLLFVVASRVGMYLQPSIILSLCMAVGGINRRVVKLFSIFALIAFTLHNYYVFVTSDIYGPSYANFQTIFSVMF